MPGHAAKRNIKDLPPYEIAVVLIKHYETLHKSRHWPTIGYGHVVQHGEPYRKGIQLTERQADALLRKDLNKFVAFYDHLPKYKFLLGALAYNIGPGAVNKSSVYKKLSRGDTYIYKAPVTVTSKGNGIVSSMNVVAWSIICFSIHRQNHIFKSQKGCVLNLGRILSA